MRRTSACQRGDGLAVDRRRRVQRQRRALHAGGANRRLAIQFERQSCFRRLRHAVSDVRYLVAGRGRLPDGKDRPTLSWTAREAHQPWAHAIDDR